jgi:predicted transcriptional regulator
MRGRLSATAAPRILLVEAPLDDEPDDDDFDGGLTEARADAHAGRVVSHEEVKRRWGTTVNKSVLPRDKAYR